MSTEDTYGQQITHFIGMSSTRRGEANFSLSLGNSKTPEKYWKGIYKRFPGNIL